MTVKGLWERLISKLLDRTPGVGNQDAADAALQRSEDAMKSVKQAETDINPHIRYIRQTVAQNHFRDKVAAAFGERT